MIKKQSYLALTLLVLSFILSLPAQAHGHKEHNDRKECKGTTCPYVTLKMKDELGLSKDQTAKLQKITRDLDVKIDTLKKQSEKMNDELDRAATAPKTNEAKIKNLVTGISNIHGEMRFAKIKAGLDTKALLTADQQAQVAKGGKAHFKKTPLKTEEKGSKKECKKHCDKEKKKCDKCEKKKKECKECHKKRMAKEAAKKK